jgi:hypothetical protein
MLPAKIRHSIYDILQDIDDLSSVFQASRQLRADIVSRLPGGKYIDYGSCTGRRAQGSLLARMAKVTNVKHFNIVAVPEFSAGHTLRFEVIWRYLKRDDDAKSQNARRHTCKTS